MQRRWRWLPMLTAILALILAGGSLQAQEEVVVGWQKAADLSLALSQTGYNNSWEGSETGALAWTFNGNLEAQKLLSAKFDWKNTLKLTFGQQHSQAKDAAGQRTWLSPSKAADRIFLESLLRATLGWVVDPYAAFVFESQFYDPVQDKEIAETLTPEEIAAAAGFENPKRYIHPIALTESAGISRKFIAAENAELSTRLGFAVRQHLTRSVAGLNPAGSDYALESTTITDGGLEWVTDFSRTFGSEMKYVTKLRVFQALFNSQEDELKGTSGEDDWRTADLAWENMLSASVAKYVQVSLFAELLYDKEIDLRGRFREILGLGVSYRLF